MTAQADLLHLVIDSVVAALNCPSESVGASSRLVQDLGAESIDMLDISFELEQRLGRELNFLEIIRFAQKRNSSGAREVSVGDIVGYLEELISGGKN
ncbi:MAG: acyl carrier protein [Bdellovibrionota bacterium]